jgi:hypothetical protein
VAGYRSFVEHLDQRRHSPACPAPAAARLEHGAFRPPWSGTGGVVLAVAEPVRAGLRLAPPLAWSVASRRAALWVVRRDLDDDDRESVGITGHHLDQAPGLARRLLLDRDIGGGESLPLALHVADLKQ